MTAGRLSSSWYAPFKVQCTANRRGSLTSASPQFDDLGPARVGLPDVIVRVQVIARLVDRMTDQTVFPSSSCRCRVVRGRGDHFENRVDLPARYGRSRPTIPPGGKVKSSFRSTAWSPIALDRPSDLKHLVPRRGHVGVAIWARRQTARARAVAISCRR